MDKKRIVISGIGAITSAGVGKEPFWKGIMEGMSSIKPVTLFDTSSLRAKLAGEITDFDPKDILGPKGLRNLDRTSLLALSASKLAFEDAGINIPITEDDTDDYGVALGSTMGSVNSISEFDKQSLIEGPRAVNPGLFPNTVMNSPASRISIRFNIQGFNTTISTGFCASLDAVSYAVNMMENYDNKVVLAGGVEELCEQTYKAFHKIGHLAGSRLGKNEINCPFDRRRNGIVMGEGASIFVLEELEHALTRNANIYGEILGYGTSFDPKSRFLYNPMAVGAVDSMKRALSDAEIDIEAVDYISASANSTLDCDVMETKAIKRLFGKRSSNIPVSSVKSMIGESFSASGAMNIAASMELFRNGFLPPTLNYEKKDRRCDLDYVPNPAQKKDVKTILVNSFSPTGNNSSLVIGGYK